MSVDPSSLRLVTYPDPVLRKRAAEIPAVTDEVRGVATRMIEIMYAEEGIGLAAPQVGVPWRMFVVDVPAKEAGEGEAAGSPPTSTGGPRVYINPVLVEPAGGMEPFEEGCLSLPEIRGDVNRPPVITIEALDAEGRRVRETAGGLLARCWQHEMDHLDGVLIIDRMTQMSRLRVRSKLRDLERSR